MADAPLNPRKRGNKPKKAKRRYQDNWSTLGEPSGKFDYYVKYTAPPDTTPIDEVVPTGWDDYPTEHESDYAMSEQEGEYSWQQEELAMQSEESEKDISDQEGRLPDMIAAQKEEAKREPKETALKVSEEEDKLPYPKFRRFMAKYGKDENAYPASSGAESLYNPPSDSVMGPPVYPPATGHGSTNPNITFTGRLPKAESFGQYSTPYWTLPPAYTNTGVMLVLPSDPGLWDDVISRWESVTINKLNEQNWQDNKSKLTFVENLLGEMEKKAWQQWRTAYPEAYAEVENIADDPQNITSQVRQVITLEDPYRGSTEEQDRAYRALERLTCERTTDLWEFMDHFRILAIKSGKLYFPTTMEKFFSKLPHPFSKKLEEAFKVKYPGVQAGVLPAIKFTHSYITDMCRDAALQKELRNLSVCAKIPLPGVYSRDTKGRYGLRKAKTYKGKPHDTHLKIFRNKYKNDRGRVRKCKCFICGREGHFARDCKSKTGNMARASILNELYQELGEDYDVVSADQDDSSVCSFSEGEAGATAYNLGINTTEETYTQEFAFMFRQEECSQNQGGTGFWRPEIELPSKSKICEHNWEENRPTAHIQCYFCNIRTTDRSRLHCPSCALTSCALCSAHYLKRKVTIRRIEAGPPKEASRNADLLELITKKDEEIRSLIVSQTKESSEKEYGQQIKEQEWLLAKKDWQLEKISLIRDLEKANQEVKEAMKYAKELQKEKEEILRIQNNHEEQNQKRIGRLETSLEEVKSLLKKKEEELEWTQKQWETMESAEDKRYREEEFDKVHEQWEMEKAIKDREKWETEQYQAKNCSEVTKAQESPKGPKRINNMLYNVNVEFDIHGVKPFTARAIIDTGATACCLRKDMVPKEAIEPLKYEVWFNGLNSRQPANHKLKPGYFKIEGEKFRIPLVYILDMRTGDGIDMLIGTNFTRSMNGGIRIEGNEITIYKKVTKIRTNPHTEEAAQLALDEEGVNEEYYVDLKEIINYTHSDGRNIRKEFGPILDRLQEQGYIGDKPLEHWSKNKVKCKLEIINPDITVQDQPLKHVTPALEVAFQQHIKALLDLGVIRPSKSRHRTMAMIVNSGTILDPKTGKEIKGKERMVFNYRTLNDNTYKDQYSLPGINTLLKRIGNAKIFSKFDLKSGFHQVAMDEESIPWTAFLAPPGKLYEWLVMPFGLKNAPAVFQRKMDNCFQGTEEFIAVYIDDILVYSDDEKHHKEHLLKMLSICEDNGLILSPTKMKVASPEIEFLGAIIGNGRIKLQEHIVKKIVDFSEEKLKSKAGMRSFLGILNYARSYIPNLGTLTAPLHEKTNPNGDKRMKPSDYEIIKKIKHMVQKLPELEIPPKEAYIIIEVDGCMEGWGGICKWKNKKFDPKAEEKICAYSSGKFKNPQATIDAEINACINTLEKMKIYYLDKEEITLRTDCQAIISFHNKTNSNKATRVRWLRFADTITGTGVRINIEHIEGKRNILADVLSRLVNLCFAECTEEMQTITMEAMAVAEEIQSNPRTPGTSLEKEKSYLKQVTRTLNHHFAKGHYTQQNPPENTEDCKRNLTDTHQDQLSEKQSGKQPQTSKLHHYEGRSEDWKNSTQFCHTELNYTMLPKEMGQKLKPNGSKRQPKTTWGENSWKQPTNFTNPTDQVTKAHQDPEPKTKGKAQKKDI